MGKDTAAKSIMAAIIAAFNPLMRSTLLCGCLAASFSDGEDTASEGVVEVRMTVDESGDVSMLSGEVNKWFRLHADMPVDTLMDPALLVANTHILFNPKRGDIKVKPLLSHALHVGPLTGRRYCSIRGLNGSHTDGSWFLLAMGSPCRVPAGRHQERCAVLRLTLAGV